MQPSPTGRQIALQLKRHYPDQDWIADLARSAGESRDKIEWHLQEDMQPPAHIAEAAADLLEKEPETGDAKPAAQSNLTSDDLPFSGVPEFIGKLHKN